MFKKKNKKINTDNINVSLNVKDNENVKILNITEQDLKYLKNMHSFVVPNITKIVDRFYRNIESESLLVDIINNNSSTSRLKVALSKHLDEMFSGVLDANYLAKRKRVAEIHLRIGLPSQFYISSFDVIMSRLFEIIHEEENIPDPIDKVNSLKAVSKIINLEQQLVLSQFDSYTLEIQENERLNRRLLAENVIDSSSTLASVSEEVNSSYHQLQEQTRNMMKIVELSVNIAKLMLNKADESRTALEKQSESMNNIIESIKQIENDLIRLNEANKLIEGVLDTVNGIASQTQLLSLNASIEAARAGEHGKGFAVVAQEVRKLADETMQAVVNVRDLLDRVNKGSKSLHSTVNDVNVNVKNGDKILVTTSEGFVDIINNIRENNANNNSLISEVDGLSEIVNELSQAFEQVAESASTLSDLSCDLLK